MEHNLTGKTILIIEGSLLAGSELRDAFSRAGARVYLTANVINAFNLLKRITFDGAVIDQGLHNAAFDLCSELQDLDISYIYCAAPHRLQKSAARLRDADHAVWRLAGVISSRAEASGNCAFMKGVAAERSVQPPRHPIAKGWVCHR